ncbi:CdaR family protein [Lentiprolixibacter aurantiacus]|uniref:CdaR family protein n=1 Tax=Lentiprolixibacter aurantiacus TaxID=2993939 RepID=A0AAE3SND2_9FLAO|nr:CdaR family protein [Lentiprolixibacter aurantiacus]MCX2719385.1 CdaR family protein [Lentiprolixibacter aurantiacus]
MTAQSKKRVDKRKLQIFLVFLFCSFLIWLISKLSENYTERTTFEIVFQNVPDSLLLTSSSKGTISTLVQTSGFQMLGSGFRRNQINIDVSKVRQRGGRYYISPAEYRRQMEQQLSGSIRLQEVDRDTLFLELYGLVSRMVPVKADLNLNLAQNYLLKGPVEISPDSILLRGPENELAEITAVTTETIELKDLEEDFSREVPLMIPEEWTSINLETEKVVLSASVFRFSEKIVSVPVSILNLPESTTIKIFPNTIEILCRAELETLKELDVSQFSVAVDYGDIREGIKTLPVKIQQQPEAVQSVQLITEKVEYLLIRQ